MGNVRIVHPGYAPGVLRVIHTIGGLASRYGGPSYSVPRLCRALAERELDITLLSVADAGVLPSESVADGYRDERFIWNYAQLPFLRSVRNSSGFSRAVQKRALEADIIHNHGLWLAPNMAAGRIAQQTRTPLVISPRGMLSPAALTFSSMKKQLAWHTCQRQMIRSAACIHATSEQEYEEIRLLGLGNPVAIVPNGVDVPDVADGPDTTAICERTLLYLGRIHPKKGIDRLLGAWKKVEVDYPNWRLRIVGPSEVGLSVRLSALVKDQGITRVSFESELSGEAKLAAYHQADLFVLPTLNENFGLTVAESLAAGTPAICTKGAPWSGLVKEGCGWWIDYGIGPLTAAMARAMALPRRELKAMGSKGRAWMLRDFSWTRAAGELLDVYRWLVYEGEAPASLRVS